MQYFWSSTSSTDPTLGANWTKSDGTTGTAPANGDDVFIQAIPGVALAIIGAADMSARHAEQPDDQPDLHRHDRHDRHRRHRSATGRSARRPGRSAPPRPTAPPSAARAGSRSISASAAFTGTVLDTGISIDPGLEPLRIKGTNAANKLYVLGGRVGVATNLPGETATLAEIDVSGSAAVVDLGAGVTWTNANVAAGGTLNAQQRLHRHAHLLQRRTIVTTRRQPQSPRSTSAAAPSSITARLRYRRSAR